MTFIRDTMFHCCSTCIPGTFCGMDVIPTIHHCIPTIHSFYHRYHFFYHIQRFHSVHTKCSLTDDFISMFYHSISFYHYDFTTGHWYHFYVDYLLTFYSLGPFHSFLDLRFPSTITTSGAATPLVHFSTTYHSTTCSHHFYRPDYRWPRHHRYHTVTSTTAATVLITVDLFSTFCSSGIRCNTVLFRSPHITYHLPFEFTLCYILFLRVPFLRCSLFGFYVFVRRYHSYLGVLLYLLLPVFLIPLRFYVRNFVWIQPFSTHAFGSVVLGPLRVHLFYTVTAFATCLPTYTTTPTVSDTDLMHGYRACTISTVYTCFRDAFLHSFHIPFYSVDLPTHILPTTSLPFHSICPIPHCSPTPFLSPPFRSTFLHSVCSPIYIQMIRRMIFCSHSFHVLHSTIFLLNFYHHLFCNTISSDLPLLHSVPGWYSGRLDSTI